MRRHIAIDLVLLTVALAIYVASPLHAAWIIHEAVKTGDRVTLEKRVDWPSLRRSLKRSTGEINAVLNEISQTADTEQPSVWRRVQSAVVPYVADALIDRYVTAEGLPWLYSWRQTWQTTVRPMFGITEKPSRLSGTVFEGTRIDRVWTVWQRLDRIVVHSPLRITVEIKDRFVEKRRWRALLVLDGVRWRLSELEVLGA